MPKSKDSQKGVLLLIVLGTIITVAILAGVILKLITSQSYLTLHQINRIKAYYAARGMMNYAQYKIRNGGVWAPAPAGSRIIKYACHRGCLTGAIPPGYSSSYIEDIPVDADIPYKIQVNVYPQNKALSSSLDGKVTQVDIKTEYTTYTP